MGFWRGTELLKLGFDLAQSTVSKLSLLKTHVSTFWPQNAAMIEEGTDCKFCPPCHFN
jgi:hypothetical protein